MYAEAILGLITFKFPRFFIWRFFKILSLYEFFLRLRTPHFSTNYSAPFKHRSCIITILFRT
ncbi:hypothetical protein, partial [uncultured Campylobacter sp.]|uniref:hypothetical protein n=1 Tax=uncultured Campylobacter sp. TaxID=218934 RepID=UPI002617CDD0